jgi:hypothetical protein
VNGQPVGPNVYERAIEVLRERGWHQHSLESQMGGGVCILGAVSIALNQRTAFGDLDYPPCSLVSDLREVIRGAGWEPDKGVDLSAVVAWNDEPQRTVEDVLLVLKHAAAEFDA